jgi:ABC-type spermidine/putrescine transport system permease subunit I
MGYFDPKPPESIDSPTRHPLLWRVLEIALIVIIICLLAALWLPIWIGRDMH